MGARRPWTDRVSLRRFKHCFKPPRNDLDVWTFMFLSFLCVGGCLQIGRSVPHWWAGGEGPFSRRGGRARHKQQPTVTDAPCPRRKSCDMPADRYSSLGCDERDVEPGADDQTDGYHRVSILSIPRRASDRILSQNPTSRSNNISVFRILLEGISPGLRPRNGVSTRPQRPAGAMNPAVPSSGFCSAGRNHRCGARGLDDRKYHAQNEQPGRVVAPSMWMSGHSCQWNRGLISPSIHPGEYRDQSAATAVGRNRDDIRRQETTS